jgi:sulfoxide reductase heme-binding subunit YedZ
MDSRSSALQAHSPVKWPWLDRTGQFVPLKLAVFVALFMPAGWLLVRALHGTLGSRPVMETIHQTGLWAIRWLAIAYAVSPLRYATRWSRLLAVRRMLGLAALAYALGHLLLYVVNEHFDLLHVASEIALRIYLTIGFVALLALCLLGSTSTDAMIRRLGAVRWNRLHRVIYVAIVLAVVHFFMQSKLDVTEPTIMAGIFALLAGLRPMRRWRRDLGPVALATCAVLAAALTAGGEALWFTYSTGAPPSLVLAADFDFSYTIRPAWYVLGAGLVLVLGRLARPLFEVAPAARPAQPGTRTAR